MMKCMKKLLTVIICLLMMEANQLYAQDQNFWIFLCFGQSNMAGMAPIEEQDLTVSDRYLSMATTDGSDGRVLGTWRKAVPPLCRADAHLGPVDYFGRTLLETVPDSVRIGVVSVAVEGCPPVSRRGGARRIQRSLCPCQSHHRRYCQPLSQYLRRLL